MIYARQKRKENIAEYILYMWQIEDIIRAHDHDLDKLDQNIISAYRVEEETRNEMRSWYDNLIRIMANEKIERSGHCRFITNLVNDLNDLHLSLLMSPDEYMYQELYKRAQPNIIQLQLKAKNSFENEIDACLHGLYGLLLLNLQKKTVTSQTKEAFGTISKLLAILAQKYRENENNDQNYPYDPGLN